MFPSKVRLLRSKHTLASRLVLGIETSCDDTGAAVMDGTGTILGESLHSQKEVHLRWVSHRLLSGSSRHGRVEVLEPWSKTKVISRCGQTPPIIKSAHVDCLLLLFQVVSGGVASNQYIRKVLTIIAERTGLRLLCPPARFCTDNGVMIAWNGVERLREGKGVLAPDVDVSYEPKAPLGVDISAEVRAAAIRLPSVRIKIPD
ncbi:PREDICTED: probable tRNA N6-adenosine threonylcarbamoyltransferase, mitochondrial [Cyprinodon variegatus]|uniref:probable tRNA N6-adenosine threonylcarbamoyltransferase, mitochondrial n=1 Tax=Cyprinodon variegatus TaxID=28743 RepID=UPI000742C8E9|nr:PREDICTED: probable tRNA N6-adenosine threonylcarbamoyltransferase, mitochondrial [Cyprinodon variegatus]